MAVSEMNYSGGGGGLSEYIPSSDITVSGYSFSASWTGNAKSVLVCVSLGGAWHTLIFGVGNTTDFWYCYGSNSTWQKLTFSGTSYSGTITATSISITTNATVTAGNIIIVPLASDYPTSM